MSLEQFLDTLPEYAKDIKLNISSALTELGSPGLTLTQIAGIALASAYAIKDQQVITFLQQHAATQLNEAEINAVKGATALMAMNNVYYRFTHMVTDTSYQTMPAKLRMNFLRTHGIAKENFELYSLAVSAVNACQMCIDTHVAEVVNHGISKEGVQSTIRIAASVTALAQVSVIQANQV
jgi:alkyl hydroperoxide reductase subunit D